MYLGGLAFIESEQFQTGYRYSASSGSYFALILNKKRTNCQFEQSFRKVESTKILKTRRKYLKVEHTVSLYFSFKDICFWFFSSTHTFLYA